MPQSFAQVYLHTVFSTKHRLPTILDEWREELFAEIGRILRLHGCQDLIIGGVPDHIHILHKLSRTIEIGELVSHIKTFSSSWIRKVVQPENRFYWQDGYATFSVDRFRLDVVREYIRTQPEHHKHQTYQDELRNALRENEMEWDERYVWE